MAPARVAVLSVLLVCGARSLQAETLQVTRSSPIDFLQASEGQPERPGVAFVPRAPVVPPFGAEALTRAMGDGLAGALSAALPSPVPITSFAGLDGQWSVPDTMGAVGPQHVMTTLNTRFRIQDRSGRVLATMTPAKFWSAGGTRYHYDPRVLYDHFRDRWIVVEAYRDDPQHTAGIAVAVSRTGNPTGRWNRYAFATLPSHWVDYPRVGINAQSFSVTLLAAVDNGIDQREIVYVFDKEPLYTGSGPITANYATAPPDSLAPVSVYGTTEASTYFVASLPGQNSVRIYREAPGALVEVATVAAREGWSEWTPLLPQLGSEVRISPEDTRVTNAVLRNGALWFVQTIFLPQGNATRSAVQWWKVSTDGRLLDIGRIDDPSGVVSYCFPSIAVNRDDDVIIGFSEVSAEGYPSAAYAVRSAADPPGAFRTSVALKRGEAPYADTRWGDYSATTIDPDDESFWTVQQYARYPSGGPRWGVWWGHIAAPAGPPLGRRRGARH